MSDSPRFFLTLDGKRAGPFTLVALREMASAHAFTSDTLAAPEYDHNWQPIHAIPALRDALFPAAAKLQLKAKTITPTVDSVTPVSVEDLLRTNLSAESRTTSPANLSTPIHPRRSPGRARNRDFAIALITCNALGLAAFFLLPRSPYIAIPLLAYFVVINVGLYWIFYHVMDRY
jgi:hypothetical protein